MVSRHLDFKQPDTADNRRPVRVAEQPRRGVVPPNDQAPDAVAIALEGRPEYGIDIEPDGLPARAAAPVGVEVQVLNQFIPPAPAERATAQPNAPVRESRGMRRRPRKCRYTVAVQVVANRIELRQARDLDQAVTVGVVDRRRRFVPHRLVRESRRGIAGRVPNRPLRRRVVQRQILFPGQHRRIQCQRHVPPAYRHARDRPHCGPAPERECARRRSRRLVQRLVVRQRQPGTVHHGRLEQGPHAVHVLARIGGNRRMGQVGVLVRAVPDRPATQRQAVCGDTDSVRSVVARSRPRRMLRSVAPRPGHRGRGLVTGHPQGITPGVGVNLARIREAEQ